VLLGFAAACSSGSPGSRTPTAATAVATQAATTQAPETAVATGSVVASPTTDAGVGGTAVDGERALAHVRKLSVDIGSRVAGTPNEIAARDYIEAQLKSYGYDVTLQDFGFDSTQFRPVRVTAGDTTIPGYAFVGSGAGTVTAAVVAAGIGRPEEFPAGGLKGAIALIERGDLTFNEKSANAIAAGAGAVVIYNNAAGRLSADLEQPVAIPVAGIEQAAGEDLAQRAQAGTLTATVEVTPPQGTAWNVVAKPKGAATCTTVTGGHYDSVAAALGADDNASGTAAVIELARVVAARGLTAGNCFALFSAEEFGLFGSKAYVDALPPADLNALRAMVNLDVVGLPETLELIGDADLTDLARIEAQKLGIDSMPSSIPNGAGSDHLSFQRAGVPVLMLYRNDELIHTPSDAIDRISADSLGETVTVALAALQALNP
jgi:Zn-dependent M28 family amino/carboxypeptidase